jgi:DNA-binding MarR family transcriptional regulator
MKDPITDDQIAALSTAIETFSRRYKLKDTGNDRPLAEIDVQTLFFVRNHPGCGPSDIARYFNVALTTISSATDRLAKRGLLIRERPEGDRRAVALRLASLGEDYVAEQDHAYQKMFRMLLGKLTLAERTSFIAIMTKIADSED